MRTARSGCSALTAVDLVAAGPLRRRDRARSAAGVGPPGRGALGSHPLRLGQRPGLVAGRLPGRLSELGHLRVVAGGRHGGQARWSGRWRRRRPPGGPGTGHVVAFAEPRRQRSGGRRGQRRWLFATPPGPRPTRLAWSADGSRLLVADARSCGSSIETAARLAPPGAGRDGVRRRGPHRQGDQVAASSPPGRAAPSRLLLLGPAVLPRSSSPVQGPSAVSFPRPTAGGCCSPGRAPTSGCSSTSPIRSGWSPSPASPPSSTPGPPPRRLSPELSGWCCSR